VRAIIGANARHCNQPAVRLFATHCADCVHHPHRARGQKIPRGCTRDCRDSVDTGEYAGL